MKNKSITSFIISEYHIVFIIIKHFFPYGRLRAIFTSLINFFKPIK